MLFNKLVLSIKNNLNIFYFAVSNEIAIDKYVIDKLNRINKKQTSFIPVRPMKSLARIQSLKIGKQLYLFLSICFFLVSPFLFFLQLVRQIIFAKTSKSKITINTKVMLNTDPNTVHLSSKTNEKEIQPLIIKPSTNKKNHNIASTFKAKHFLLAYLYSIAGIVYLSLKTKDKRNIIQSYIALDFFLVMFALKDLRHNLKTVYFCNHFDRWAVLIDSVLFDKELILIQHGVLPESIYLPYKLRNIKKILTFNKNNEARFKNYVLTSNSNTTFATMDVSLDLKIVKHNKKTILVISQPHSFERELEILNRISEDFMVYIKPHPAFSFAPYTNLKNTILIEERHYYPKVDLVLNYESTLGIEYEASNIRVIWWKDMNINELIQIINQTPKIS